MIGRLIGLQDDGGYKGQVRPARLLVDGAVVHLQVCHPGTVDGVDVDDGHELKEHFVLGLDEFRAAFVPAGALQVQPVHVDALRRRLADVVLRVARYLVVQDHRVEGPALVSSCHFLR